MTEHFTRQSSCTFQSKKMGRMAKIQSLIIDTKASAYERVVWILRSWQKPSIVVNQFFLGDVRIIDQHSDRSSTYCTG